MIGAPDAAPRNVPPVSWAPVVGPQRLAYESLADEMYYGGAAGGGKTDLDLGLALTQHDRTLFLRREATQLVDAVERCKQIVGPAGQWRGIGYGGIMRVGRRTIEFHGCKDPDDWQKFAGRPHDLKVLDELPHFLKAQYVGVKTWNRSTRPGQRCRVVGSGNPPTSADGMWVMEYWKPWLDPTAGRRALPGELLWYAMVDGKEVECENGTPFTHRKELIHPRSRTFIPALLSDNPYLRDTGYVATLQSLPEPLRSQYLYGDFSAALQDDPWQVIPTHWVKAAMARWSEVPPEGIPLSAAGLDIAYGGSDRTVYVPRHGDWIGMPACWKGAETDSGEKAADLVLPLLGASTAPVYVDGIGWGAAAYESLKRKGVKAEAVLFGGGCNGWTDKRRVLAFTNIRAFCYWQLRDALDPDLGRDLALPPDPDLLAELTAGRYEVVGGRLKIEPKADIADRLGRSPDKADAVALAVYDQPRTSWHFEVVKAASRPAIRNGTAI